MIILLVSIAAATLLFGKKMHGVDDNMDKMERALTGAKPFIAAGTNLQLRNIKGKNELHFWARYQFTPHYMSYKTTEYDTVLTICPILAMMPIMAVDSILKATGNRDKKLLWQNKDEEYYYFLTCTH